MDKLQWFKFSPVDWLMGKIQRVPEITQIRFIRLVCLYWNKECILSIEDAEIEIDKEHLDMLVSKKIVKLFNGRVVIEFLDEQLEGIAGTREERKRAANIRWDNYRKGLQDDANALQNSNDAMQSDAEESREENINNNLAVDWDKFLKQFNAETNKKIRVLGEKEKRQIKARLKEGHTKEDLVRAIQNCYNDPFHKENNHKYLTPEFITRPDKFTKYLNQ